MPRLHLLNKEGPEFPQPGHCAPGAMESGWWRVAIKRAESVIGHPIHFHRRKAEAAFLSGVITGYRRENYATAKGRTSPRTVFIFTPDDAAGVTTETYGWTHAGVKLVP